MLLQDFFRLWYLHKSYLLRFSKYFYRFLRKKYAWSFYKVKYLYRLIFFHIIFSLKFLTWTANIFYSVMSQKHKILEIHRVNIILEYIEAKFRLCWITNIWEKAKNAQLGSLRTTFRQWKLIYNINFPESHCTIFKYFRLHSTHSYQHYTNR